MSILHTSTILNLPKIIKDGYLLPKYPDDETVSVKGVYGVYVFDGMNYNGKYWYYGSNTPNIQQVIFVIKPSALKDLRFFACPSISYGNCLISSPEDIIISNGIPITSNKIKNITKFIPKHINKLEYFINTKLPEKEDATAKKIQNKKTKIDMWDALTHEVVFLEPIPLQYINAIIVAPSMVTRVTEYIEKKKLINGQKEKHNNTTEYTSELQLKVLRRPIESQWKTVLFN